MEELPHDITGVPVVVPGGQDEGGRQPLEQTLRSGGAVPAQASEEVHVGVVVDTGDEASPCDWTPGDRDMKFQRTWSCTSRAPGRATRNAAGQRGSARMMIERFLDAGHQVGWVAGDEVYGGNPKLRAALEERGLGYVLAVACSAEARTGAGTFRADALVKKAPKRAWQKLSAGRGAKGQRFYDWVVIDLADPAPATASC